MLKWSVNNIKTDGMVDSPNSPVHQITISGKNYKSQVTFSNDNDHISFRHHVYSKENGNTTDKVSLYEVGPRFEMRLYQIKLGTLEMKDAENEYVLKPYMNTAHKRTVL